MGARAEALRLPGKGSGHRAEWAALGAFVLVAALAMTLVLTTQHTATVPTVRENPAKLAPVSGDGVRVGGTSIYQYHPLPATNFGGSASAPEAVAVEGNGVRVGGTSVYQYHPLPSTNFVAAASDPEVAPAAGISVGGSGPYQHHSLP